MDLEALRKALEQPITWEIAGPARDAAGFRHDAGPLVFEARSGAVAPVQVRLGEVTAPAGWVFVGEATGRARWPDAHAGRRFAARQVLRLDAAKERMAAVAAGGDFVSAVDRALLLQAGATVPGTLPVVDARDAASALKERLQQLDGVVSVGRWLPLQAGLVAQGALAADETVAWLDVRTADRFGVVRKPEDKGAAPEDRWLGALRDDTGAYLDRGRCARLAVAGRDMLAGTHYRALAEVPCATGPAVTVTRTDASFVAHPREDGYSLVVDGTVQLELGASRPARVIPLDVDFLRDAVDGTARVTAHAADGARLDLVVPTEAGAAPDRVVVVLPEALPAGGTATVKLTVRDTWRFGTPGALGKSTGLVWPYARVVGALPGLSGAATVRIAAPEDLDIVLSGPTRAGVAEGMRFAEASQTGGHRLLAAAVGRFESAAEAALPSSDPHQKQPAVEVHLLGDAKAAVPTVLGFSRTVIAWMNTVLPPFPADALAVFQAPDGWGGYTWRAPQGVVVLQQARVAAHRTAGFDQTPHRAESTFAHEIAHQYWGNVLYPAAEADWWIAETFAEVYADLFAGAAWGEAAWVARRDLHREACEEDLERHASVSLTMPGNRSYALYDCGPYLFGHALRERIGTDALLGALDGFARTHADVPVTTEALLAAIQAATPVDLTDFWEAWVYGGYVPLLAGTWSATPDGGVAGVVTADVPFYTYDVPVRVVRGNKAETVWVKVRDGQGAWSLPAGPKVERVDLDPHGLLLARGRAMRKK